MSRSSPRQADTLRALVQSFVRAFGLLGDAQTPCGLPLNTSHAHALMLLRGAEPNGMHQAELGRRLGIDKSNASRLAGQLAKNGHAVVASAPDEDARIKRIRLTAKGSRLAASVERASRRRFAELLADIERPHHRAVFEGLEQLTRALERRTKRRKRA